MGVENCIIVHGSTDDKNDTYYNKHWMPWAKQKLTKLGIATELPIMPTPWAPDYNAYKKVFETFTITEKTILIGHSSGCAFLARWLSQTKQKIAQLIFVAPWIINDEGGEIRDQFYTFEIDQTLQKRIGHITMFTSNDEEEAGKQSLGIFSGKLGGKIIELPNKGHYTIGDMGSEEFPELIESLLQNRK